MFAEKVFYSKYTTGGYLNYLEYIPRNATGKLPLIIYLHGAGSRGHQLSQLAAEPIHNLQNGLAKQAAGVIILEPQCYTETWFDLYSVLVEFIDDARQQENVDHERVYIVGVSMGAYATWQLCISYPEWFAAAVPVCGGGMYWAASRLKDLPVWAFHGAMDDVVFPEESIKMVAAINRNGGHAKLTIFPHDDHNSWDSTFASNELWQWLFTQRRKK